MQTILGANGVIGKNTALHLQQYSDQIRLVSRQPKKVNDTDELFTADLLQASQVREAVKGSSVVYLTAGITYKYKLWRDQWPVIMTNVINACKEQQCKLVFFDNVYAYGKVNGWMTEDCPYNPCSKKGEVRAAIATQLMDEAKKGNLEAMIVRSADFYGPHTPLSFINVMLMEKFAKGKKGQLMLNDTTRHSFTYTPDAGKAMALLGNTPSAYNQVWHAPTDKQALTLKEFAAEAAVAFGVNPGYQVLSRFMLRLAGLFIPVVKESLEMLYQNETDYLFSSEKFERAFSSFPITTYKEGIAQTAASMK
jgi:nucleoside-diphosphate-sugar epimerase